MQVVDAGGGDHRMGRETRFCVARTLHTSFASVSLAFTVARIFAQVPALTACKISRMHLSARKTRRIF